MDKRSSSSHSSSAAATAAATMTVVCSNDLTQLVVHQQGSTILKLVEVVPLQNHRYQLQTMASLHSSIQAHLDVLQTSAREVGNSWKSSLKPLDDKLSPLLGLLQNYGVEESMSQVLRQYLLVGHTSASSNLANAMDQFFTGVQMNDQLLQRMERSLQASVANVETLVRKQLISPARALNYHVGELGGVLRFYNEEMDDTTTTTCLVLLEQASERVLMSVERLLTDIIQARFQLRDFCEWLRSTGSQIKARGTAANSVQRENAKKRRVPHAVIQRMVQYLAHAASLTENNSTTSASGNASAGADRKDKKTTSTSTTALSEILLGMNVSVRMWGLGNCVFTTDEEY
jgi:hypothetical protein